MGLRTPVWAMLCASASLCLSSAALARSLPSVGFYYGGGAAPAALRDFHWIVVEPGRRRLPRDFAARQKVFAYASMGETTPGNPRYARLPGGCVLGRDTVWGGRIIDLARRDCREYLLRRVIDPLWQQGYRGFFLDALDSYESLVHSARGRAAEQTGLVRLIGSIEAAHPGAALIANRGFTVLARVHRDLVGVVAESLFHGWSQRSNTYRRVPAPARHALIRQLRRVRAYGLPAIVIDYLPARLDRRGWWQDARRIAGMGFVPYVTNGHLTAVGAGLREPMPRHVLILYNSAHAQQFSLAFADGAMPLEYLGYIPVFSRLSRSLPARPTPGEYAGIIVWDDLGRCDDAGGLSSWLRAARAAGIPLLLLQNFPDDLDRGAYRALGMSPPHSRSVAGVTIERATAAMNYEARVRPNRRDFLQVAAPRGSRLWLRLRSDSGAVEDAAAITPWGGYVLPPYLLTALPDGKMRWLVDPFRLYRAALHLPRMPVPDTTTESGRRLFMAHTDGDGFLSRAQFPPYHIAGEVYMHRIVERYKLPFTGSVIVGDLLPGNRGLYPALAPLGTEVARRLFRLPYVEIGSHMWSHPFDWPDIEAGENLPGNNLPVPGYTFSPYMEAVGAARWIDTHLAPPGKRVVIDQWSGDCDPDAEVVGLAYRAGLMNINGGTAYISRRNPTLTAVPPIGIFRGKWLQVFAPDANEDYFTNLWHGPYWGYINVIQTFAMTDRPHRLKPIDIYTHWYSGSTLASLAAVKKVYHWVLQRPITPIYAANYARIVANFFAIHIARQGNGFWIGGAEALRELRMPKSLGMPAMARSQGIAGYDDSPNGRLYVHMDGQPSVRLALRHTPTRTPYIVSANAPIAAVAATATAFTARVHGHVPVRLRLANIGACRVALNGHPASPGPAGRFASPDPDVIVHVRCP